MTIIVESTNSIIDLNNNKIMNLNCIDIMDQEEIGSSSIEIASALNSNNSNDIDNKSSSSNIKKIENINNNNNKYNSEKYLKNFETFMNDWTYNQRVPGRPYFQFENDELSRFKKDKPWF